MYKIGVDLGGTNIAVGLLDDENDIIAQHSVPTNALRDNDLILEDIANLCMEIIKENNVEESQISSIGLGSPGTCNISEGIILNAFNLGFENINLKEKLNRYFDNVKVFVGNDADVAAFGECKMGAGKGYNSVVMITLGTGLGGGVIIDGKIINGSYNCGGEMGHMTLNVGGEQCTCGRKGCWEAYSSATGLIKMGIKKCKEDKSSKLYKFYEDAGNLNGKIIFDLAKEGDPVSKAVVEEYIMYLSEGVSSIINLLEPEVFIIGGGISGQGDYLLEPLKVEVYKRVFGGSGNTKLKIATLGNNAGIIGAAMLEEMFQ